MRGQKAPYETDATEPSDVVAALDMLESFYALFRALPVAPGRGRGGAVLQPSQVMLVTLPEWYIEGARRISRRMRRPKAKRQPLRKQLVGGRAAKAARYC